MRPKIHREELLRVLSAQKEFKYCFQWCEKYERHPGMRLFRVAPRHFDQALPLKGFSFLYDLLNPKLELVAELNPRYNSIIIFGGANESATLDLVKKLNWSPTIKKRRYLFTNRFQITDPLLTW